MKVIENLRSSLAQLTLLEIGDQSGDYGAMLFAGLGANVIKIEPVCGSPSRRIGPFATPQQDRESSLFFWRYNLNKKSIALDMDSPVARAVMSRLSDTADIVLLSGEFKTVDRQLKWWRQIAEEKRRLIVCSITPFGLDGPYRDFKSTDLTQLAMGGIMAMCGYDPNSDGVYDTPPIAPPMWHSYHVAGEYAAVTIMAAVNFRDLTNDGQFIDTSMHEAINTCTELSIPIYLHNGEVVKRQTARHAMVQSTPLRLPRSSDGVPVLAGLSPLARDLAAFVRLADDSGIPHELRSAEFEQWRKNDPGAADEYLNQLVDKIVGSISAEEVFIRAQTQGLPWAPIRRPEQNLQDPHFISRGSFATIEHSELGRDLLYPGTVAGDGISPHMSYTCRAPRLGEHSWEVLEKAGFTRNEIEEMARQKAIVAYEVSRGE